MHKPKNPPPKWNQEEMQITINKASNSLNKAGILSYKEKTNNYAIKN